MDLSTMFFEQTKELKSTYLTTVKNWAYKNYSLNKEKEKWQIEQWLELIGVKPVYREVDAVKEGKYIKLTIPHYPTGFHNTHHAKLLDKLKKDVARFKNMTLDDYLDLEVKTAEKHYNNSILKLTERIKNEQLDLQNIKLSSSNIKENFETFITDGNKKIKAYTIIASGEVQKPHYRYLIKKIK